MFSFIPFAAREFLGKWWPAILAAVVILAAVIMIYSRGVNAGKTGEQLKSAEREIELKGDIIEANENASAARVEGEVELEQQKKELEDAQRDITDVDRARCERGRVIMRQQGRDPSRIPACR